jgi:alanyl-tRNA synthetase
LEHSVSRLAAENAAMKKTLEAFKQEKIAATATAMKDKAVEINGFKVISGVLEVDADSLKQIAYQFRTAAEELLGVFGTVEGGKPNLTVALSDDLVASGLQAGKLVREAAALIQGGGGGQPSLAQAGGKNCDGIRAAVDKVVSVVTEG